MRLLQFFNETNLSNRFNFTRSIQRWTRHFEFIEFNRLRPCPKPNNCSPSTHVRCTLLDNNYTWWEFCLICDVLNAVFCTIQRFYQIWLYVLVVCDWCNEKMNLRQFCKYNLIVSYTHTRSIPLMCKQSR